MLPDLERLIHLQELENAGDEARQRLDQLPARHAELDARLSTAEAALATAKQRLAESQTARREIEKELASVQTRLSKYKDQLMEVKTNKEYQAMQNEIATAERDVRSREDRILDFMEEQEALARDVKEDEARFKEEQTAIVGERKALEGEKASLEERVESLGAERDALRPQVGEESLRLFDHIGRQRRGVAVVPAVDGHCSFCHVRLRPQVFNEVRRNDRLIQCDNCLRILYFAGSANSTESQAASK